MSGFTGNNGIKKPTSKIYVTKYALTRGILEYDAVIDELNGKIFARYSNSTHYPQTFWGDDFFLLMEDAVKNAEYRKQKKINNLNRQVTRLINMKF